MAVAWDRVAIYYDLVVRGPRLPLIGGPSIVSATVSPQQRYTYDIGITAVSYTHLDVYKRQACCRRSDITTNAITTSCYAVSPPGSHTTGKRVPPPPSSACTDTRFARGSRPPKAYCSAISMTQTRAPSSGPVSYTHLDVYKRQDSTSSTAIMAPRPRMSPMRSSLFCSSPKTSSMIAWICCARSTRFSAA